MNKEQLIKIIRKGEGITTEFKSCRKRLGKDLFETVCAFLNRYGGHLVLGVEDDGNISGIDESSIKELLNNLITSANNQQKLSPPFYPLPEVYEIDGAKVIYVFVPESSSVHNTSGRVFDRNQDGDFNVTNNPSHLTLLILTRLPTKRL